MGAEAEAAAAESPGFEPGPRANAGGGSVGSDEPTVVDGLSADGGGLIVAEDDRGVPGEADAEFCGSVEEETMENRTADSDARSRREVCGDARLVGSKGDAGEFDAVLGLEVDAQGDEASACFGHEAFAAGLVDGRAESIGEEDVGAALADGDGGGEPGGACSGDEYVAVAVTHCGPFGPEGASRR